MLPDANNSALRDAREPLQTTVEELLARRRELESRLAELRAAVTQLSATTLPAAATGAVADANTALQRFDADLSALAATTHKLLAVLQQHGMTGDSVRQLLFVRCGEQTLAVPLEQIDEIRAPRDAAGLEIVSLAQLLGQPPEPSTEERVLMVEEKRGISVPQVVRQDEAVVRPLGPYFADFPLFDGAALTAEGLVLVVKLSSQ